jgi:23S rRNA (adenine1618-N6)-methyltransferase
LPTKKSKPTATKKSLHPRNKHQGRYDFTQLIACCPLLAPFVKLNPYQDLSIDFFDPQAVKMLNKALLKYAYDIDYWDIPENYLCPPIPGRADYIHHIADLLGESNQGKIPTGKQIHCLDIGVGANCIYPLLGTREYDWSFVGVDIDPVAVKSATHIVESNPGLKDCIEIRWQANPENIFAGVIHEQEWFDVTICNPPFHTSAAEAAAGSVRKVRNLTGKKSVTPALNFGGQQNELWCEGGEKQFVKQMILESRSFATVCLWFSTLISKEANLEGVYRELKKAGAVTVRTLPMAQGNKVSRIVAWTFLAEAPQVEWVKGRW